MDQFALTDDQLAIQDMARRFTADAITPHAAEWDEKHVFPKDTIRAAAELGFAAIYVSEEAGGIEAEETSFEPARTAARLDGGLIGHSYSVSNQVTFSDGTTDIRSITLRVETR